MKDSMSGQTYLRTLSAVHPIFQMFMLNKYMPDRLHKLSYKGLDIMADLSYEKEAVRILDRSLRTLRCREVPLVKELWSNRGIQEATLEHEDNMRARFHRLFPLNDDASR